MYHSNEAGLVTCERVAHDQRRVRVSLAPKSRRIEHKLVPLIEQRYELLERALGLGSIQEVCNALDALLARTPRTAEAPADDCSQSPR